MKREQASFPGPIVPTPFEPLPIMTPARGQQGPQTVRYLQQLMAHDAVTIEEQAREIRQLNARIRQLRYRLQRRMTK